MRGHVKSTYYDRIVKRLIALGYHFIQYSSYGKNCSLAVCLADATGLRFHPSTYWLYDLLPMNVCIPRLHVQRLETAQSLIQPANNNNNDEDEDDDEDEDEDEE